MLFFYCQLQAQVIDYRIVYNPTTSKYDVLPSGNYALQILDEKGIRIQTGDS